MTVMVMKKNFVFDLVPIPDPIHGARRRECPKIIKFLTAGFYADLYRLSNGFGFLYGSISILLWPETKEK